MESSCATVEVVTDHDIVNNEDIVCVVRKIVCMGIVSNSTRYGMCYILYINTNKIIMACVVMCSEQ